MSNPVRMLVTNSKARANQDASVLMAEGFDVLVTGPTTSVIVRTAEGDRNAEDAWGNPFPEMWVVFAFNRSRDQTVIVD